MQPCSVCTHAERAAIDRELAGGDSERAIAGRHGLSRSAVNRHRGHLPQGLAVAGIISPEPDKLLGYLRGIVDDATRIRAAAEAAEDYVAACAALREQSRVIQILMRAAEARALADRDQALREPMTDRDLEELVSEATAELGRRRTEAA